MKRHDAIRSDNLSRARRPGDDVTPTLRWSLLVFAEAALLLFLLMYGLTYTESALFHKIHLGILATIGGLGWAVVLARARLLPPLLVVAPLPLLLTLALTSVTSA